MDWGWTKANDGECSRCRHLEGDHQTSKSKSSHGSSDLPDKGQSTPRRTPEELADTLAEEAREAAKEHREWSARTDRMVYTMYQWEEEKDTRRSVWTAGVRKAVRKGAGQFVVKSTREKATKRWRELNFERDC